MSQEEAKRFIAKLESDAFLGNLFKGFIETEGFMCTVNDIRKELCEQLLLYLNHNSLDKCHHCHSFSNPMGAKKCPYFSSNHGYKNWEG